MKNEPIHYLGLDVHLSTTVGCVRDAEGSVLMRATVPTSEKAIVQLVGGAGRRVHVALEEGTQAQWLHDVLIEHAERVVVFNARGRGAKENKDDRIDAEAAAEGLRRGALKPVFHGAPETRTLRELVRNYENLVQDATRVMSRIKAMFRAHGISTPGVSVYRPSRRKSWLGKLDGGARVRAASLLAQLDTLQELRSKAKAAMVAAARRMPAWKVLSSIPFYGPVRVAQLMAIVRTPFRFRTKRNLWPYGGLAVVRRSSADRELVEGKLQRSRKAPMTRGLNRNHHPTLKAVFKGAANDAACRPGPLRECYEASLRRGMSPEMAKVTLARKIAAITLRLWKKGELFDPTKLTMQAT
jgi:transposase